MRDVAAGVRTLTLSSIPKVNLLVIGFDGGQKAQPSWRAHSAKMTEWLNHHGARLRAVGDPKGKQL